MDTQFLQSCTACKWRSTLYDHRKPVKTSDNCEKPYRKGMAGRAS